MANLGPNSASSTPTFGPCVSRCPNRNQLGKCLILMKFLDFSVVSLDCRVLISCSCHDQLGIFPW